MISESGTATVEGQEVELATGSLLQIDASEAGVLIVPWLCKPCPEDVTASMIGPTQL